MKTGADTVLKLAEKKRILRSRDFTSQGIPRVTLSRMVRAGLINRIGRGLYSLPGVDFSEFHTLAEVSKRVPRGIVSLLSALRFHELTTQQPFEVWLAVDRQARKPRVEYPPLRVVRFSGLALTHGIDDHVIDGVTVRITSPSRTVVDCFRYRNKIGIEVAVEALRDYLGKSRGRPTSLEPRVLEDGAGQSFASSSGDGYGAPSVFSIDTLVDTAKAMRIYTVMRPYLEALAT
jgi:predicted transcriptional regulator of viral defense system